MINRYKRRKLNKADKLKIYISNASIGQLVRKWHVSVAYIEKIQRGALDGN